ncbi:MAG TPA: hypothetical protein VGR11_09195 [Solirubrobacteraceae bacterium]|nr:hypothetical protein [Solirubrobacteraceae bacterium]
MDQREQELQRFREAVDRKSEQAREAAESTGDSPVGGAGTGDDEAMRGGGDGLTYPGRPQDTYDIRAKNAGKGKKTADKWNQ